MSTSSLLRVAEAASELNASKRWVYRQIEAGRLPAVELGSGTGKSRSRMLRVDAEDVHRLAARRVGR